MTHPGNSHDPTHAARFRSGAGKSLRELAARDNSSLNKAAIKLMRRGAGLEAVASPGPGIGSQLRQFAGQLSDAEAKAIDRAIQESREDDIKLQP